MTIYDKKSAHNVAAFRKIVYLCPAVCEQQTVTLRRAI